MARKLRIGYPGVVYHVLNRGGRREDICAKRIGATLISRSLPIFRL
jgi:hypothetical protein